MLMEVVQYTFIVEAVWSLFTLLFYLQEYLPAH